MTTALPTIRNLLLQVMSTETIMFVLSTTITISLLCSFHFIIIMHTSQKKKKNACGYEKILLAEYKSKVSFYEKCKFDTLGRGDILYYTSKHSKDKQPSFG